jgi:hypothetical protein
MVLSGISFPFSATYLCIVNVIKQKTTYTENKKTENNLI